MRSLFKSKKGHYELAIVIVMIFLTALSILIGLKIHTAFSDGVDSLPASYESPRNVMDDTANVFTILDYLFIVFIAMTTIAVVISAFYIKTTPLFFVLSIFALVVLTILSVVYSNAFELIIGSPEFTSESSKLPIIQYVMGILPYFMLFVFAIFAIALYAKGKENSGFGMN